jgi:hypothetical protein
MPFDVRSRIVAACCALPPLIIIACDVLLAVTVLVPRLLCKRVWSGYIRDANHCSHMLSGGEGYYLWKDSSEAGRRID